MHYARHKFEKHHLRKPNSLFNHWYSLPRLRLEVVRGFSKRPRRRDPFAARYSSCVQSILDTTEIALSRDLANRNRAVSVRRRNFMSSRGERKQKRRNVRPRSRGRRNDLGIDLSFTFAPGWPKSALDQTRSQHSSWLLSIWRKMVRQMVPERGSLPTRCSITTDNVTTMYSLYSLNLNSIHPPGVRLHFYNQLIRRNCSHCYILHAYIVLYYSMHNSRHPAGGWNSFAIKKCGI